jgi:hypothetical protein
VLAKRAHSIRPGSIPISYLCSCGVSIFC